MTTARMRNAFIIRRLGPVPEKTTSKIAITERRLRVRRKESGGALFDIAIGTAMVIGSIAVAGRAAFRRGVSYQRSGTNRLFPPSPA
ncbi:hypothetical protein [Inquilinus sp. CA228]|uniref:hypothetical protein n=1 Tax=Inquilinus sp. CA228 TaxID=3455609 RepID=UPI003F8D59FA